MQNVTYLSETLLGRIIAGIDMLIAIPMIFDHHLRERRLDRLLRGVKEAPTVPRNGNRRKHP